MSFTKYIESKIRPHILIVMDEYKEKLIADVSSFLLKPDSKSSEIKKQSINMREVYKILSEMNYPLKNEFWMAIRSGDFKQVNKAHLTFKRYAQYANLNVDLSDKIETILFDYQNKLHDSTINVDEVDKIVQSSFVESQIILDQMAQNIDLAISKVKKWQNHQITIHALPTDEFVISSAKVIVGNTFPASFVYEHSLSGFKVKDIQKSEGTVNLNTNMQELLSKLQQNPKYNRIMTLFMTRPLSERRIFEIAKRDLALGIEAVLPNHITLASIPLVEDMDIWKVKIEEKYLYKFLHEGNVLQYQIIGDDAPVRWIERMSK